MLVPADDNLELPRRLLTTVLDHRCLMVGTYSRFIQGGPNLLHFPLLRGVKALSYL